jgi:ribonuclease HI
VKGQIIADFIVDHSIVEESLNFVDVQSWKLYFDGFSHKKSTRVGILIISPENIPTKLKFRLDKLFSNNEAEYEALIAGFEMLLELGVKDVEIRGDSELFIKQLTKEYKCVKENLIIYFATATALLKRFDQEIIQHVPRIENQGANNGSTPKLGGGQGNQIMVQMVKILKILLKFVPLTTYQTKIGENQLSNTCKILQETLVRRLNTEH